MVDKQLGEKPTSRKNGIYATSPDVTLPRGAGAIFERMPLTILKLVASFQS